MYSVLSLEQAYAQLENEVISIGTLPVNEDPTDINGTNSNIQMCVAYINQLIRKYGSPAKGCGFFVLKIMNATGRGSIYEAAIHYPSNNSRSVSYALNVECGDLFWDEKAILELSNPKLGLRVVRKL